MSDDDILRAVSAYYTSTLERFGPTPRGVDWNSDEAQQIRFDQVLSVCAGDTFSLNDFGCGYGGLLDRLANVPALRGYTGYDVSEAMIAAARARHAGRAGAVFTTKVDELPVADFTVASGIFSVKGDVADDAWWTYVRNTVETIRRHSARGFAFNCLTAFSDPERRRADLYYADPRTVFDYCRETFARDVALLHDYGLYEFTVRVRLR